MLARDIVVRLTFAEVHRLHHEAGARAASTRDVNEREFWSDLESALVGALSGPPRGPMDGHRATDPGV